MNQQSQPTSLYPVERGDEINLIEIWKVFVEYKILIIIFIILTFLGSTYYALSLPTFYKAEVLMFPATSKSKTSLAGASIVESIVGSSVAGVEVEVERAFVRLKTHNFLISFINGQGLKPFLFPDQWDKKNKIWVNEEPNDREAVQFFSNMVETYSRHGNRNPSGLTSISVSWKNPTDLDKISEVANNLAKNINEKEKKRIILESKKSLDFLKKELEKTDVLYLRKIIYNLIEKQITASMLAKIKKETVFEIIDPAFSPKKPESKMTIIIIFSGVLAGLIFSFLIAIGVTFLRNHSETL
jgi:LPS O-antigen subunit length determinant protein (WzzB/FepE family)